MSARLRGHAKSEGENSKQVSWSGYLVSRLVRFRQGELGMLPVSLVLALIWILFYIGNPIFLSPRNLSFLLLQIALVGTLAVGVDLGLLLGEIDLAVAATAGVSAAVLAVLVGPYGWNPMLAIAVSLLTASMIGLFHSFFFAVVKIPSFVVTLAGLLILQGTMLAILGRQGAMNINDPFIRSIASTYLPQVWGWILAVVAWGSYLVVILGRRRRRRAADLDNPPLSQGLIQSGLVFLLAALVVWRLNQYLGVPLAGLLLVAVVTIWALVLSRTEFGRRIYAVGGNADAARRAGINVTRVRMSTFIWATMMFAVGGIIGASRFASVSYSAFAGGSLLLDAIGAAIIGGTSLFGGRGQVASALLGALVIGSLSNGLDLFNASSATKWIISGTILLAAVTIDALSRHQRLQTGIG